MKVSRFENIYTKAVRQVELLQELDDIKDGKYKYVIERCRKFTAENNHDKYKDLKIKLPIVTFCGTFVDGRKLANLHSYNNIMILDIDYLQKESVESIKKVLENDKYIFSVWLSPSGNGLKALVKIESSPEEHKASFDSLKQYFLDKYKIELDNSGSDVTRLCFVSWDNDLYINKNSEIYADKLEIARAVSKTDNKKNKVPKSKSLTKSAYATEGLNNREHKKMILLIIKYLKRKNISITSSFDEWFRVAIAIASTFSYDLGEKYYLSLCELDGAKHDELESINILKYCYNNRKLDAPSAISFGTLIYYAKQKGFVTKKDKFDTVSQSV